MSKRIRFLPAALIVIICVAGQAQSGPSVTGEWGPVLSWPLAVVHAHLLSSGKILMWDKTDNAHVWDPVTNTFTISPKAGYKIFCAGHSHLSDGRLLVAGGQVGGVLYGVPNASIYDPATDSWTHIPDMHAPRWYPTNTTLANGDVLVTSGQIDPVRRYVGLPQIWQTATESWQDLSSAQLILPLYPRMFLAPNGKVFYAGESVQSRYLDTTGTGYWSAVGRTKANVVRDYGSAVQYGDGKILIMGGGRNPPTATAEVIDLTVLSPTWRSVASMAYPRRQLNATLLPGGQVLVTGGTSGGGFADATHPVLAAELWDPESENWTTLASQTGYRGYHSVALLLPDATVLVAGGDPNIKTAQVFSPPYLFGGRRPAISSAPPSVNYGDTFSVGTPDAVSIAQVTLLRLGSVTHAFNQDQRFNNLTFTVADSTGLHVIAPANPNLAPPGDYMLFALNATGIPSVGKIIRLNRQKGTPPPVSLAPSSVFMPDTVVGATSSTSTARMTNNLAVPLTIANIAKSGDFAETSNCKSPISSGASCTLTITFTPTSLGVRTGTVTITDSASTSPHVLNLAGNGVPAVSTSVSSHSFSKVALGTSLSFKLYLLNNQTAPLNIRSITTSGDYSQTNHCSSPLNAGKYCDITVKFIPTLVGIRTGVLTIADDANNSPQTVTLTGTGQ